MNIIDFYPSKGCFAPGEPVTLLVEIESAATRSAVLYVHIRHLDVEPHTIENQVQPKAGRNIFQIAWMPSAQPAGYTAWIDLHGEDGAMISQASTAFDVLPCWTDFPRYGFLTDFSITRADPEATIQALTRFHINGLQFYDWQYRHDQLLPSTEEYVDPLGRKMSLASVRTLVHAAHRQGMAAMPYLAIYAASADFWRKHPDWALYDKDGNPIAFGENFLGLMDPSADGPWSQYLLAEGARALDNIPFDGLHIDQYGDPKHAWDSQQKTLDLPKAFVDFIQSASDQYPDRAIVFNAVGNWPIEELARSAVDFLYIEIWPPDVEYLRLAEIVLNAARLSHGKAVVIALYLPANRPANNLLADAVIAACGAARIELGENARLLSDPYFPKHEEISSDLRSQLRQLADFTVRCGEWLRPYTLSPAEREIWSQGELRPTSILLTEDIWAIRRKYPKKLVVQFINFTGLDSHLRWDELHSAPTPCQNISVQVQIPERPSRVCWDCPEKHDGPQALDFDYSPGVLRFEIPQIVFMGLVAIYE